MTYQECCVFRLRNSIISLKHSIFRQKN